IEKTLAVELLMDKSKKCRGLVAYNILLDEYETIYASNIVLATGGLGQVYKYTTNPKVATGDGIALAYRAGAKIQDMEFIQFHPTALTVDGGLDDTEENRFLISEALRGEGGRLCHKNREKFMQKYDEKQELASRDIVTRAIFKEMKEQKTKNVYLDVSHIDSAKLLKRFPNISNICKLKGVDITKDLIPVSPASHYTMGGVKTKIDG
ncbi:MAG: FAD-binding protein, partial [Bacteroidaceae bacterium]